MMTNKIFSYLGLAMRAGKLTMGDDGVMKAVRSGEAKLVIIAEDASDNTFKKMKDKCTSYQVDLLQFGSRIQLGDSIGKEARVVIAITDAGLSKLIRSCL